ncbi:MAG TPA: hypothetical protein VLH35_06845 [Candidatus Acidoferrales bacterium]|nr:hypothetical protein [Candidatus Acidoferrales bacterium]
MRSSIRRLMHALIVFVLVFDTVCSSLYPAVGAQEVTEFTSTDQFDISELNGSIRFAYNGTYSSATLENGTWHFNDLTLNGSQPLGNLAVSTENSDITIFSVFAVSAYAQTRHFVRYNAVGEGRQIFNLGVNGTTDVSEWWVTLPGGVFLAAGKDWTFLSDNTIIVNGQTGNVSVVHFYFGLNSDRDLPFVMRHSVVLLTGAVLAVTVAAAVLVSVRRRRQ